jgi:hypothetical protein
MPTFDTIRGFVQRLEVGRAGLVVATLLHDDGSSAEYRIVDLDADPERFNERLSKLGILRDAMTRAEPVEIEYSVEETGSPRLIERVIRITRDSNWLAARADQFDALVVDVALLAENRTAAAGEKPDTARVMVVTDTLATRALILDLQIPERQVATSQLDFILAERGSGTPLHFYVEPETNRIIGVGSNVGARDGTGEGDRYIDGFVEVLSLIPASPEQGFASVRFTTAPPFAGAGNVVALIPFTPETITLLVFRRSAAYDLFEAGLRDKLRMRVRAVVLADRPTKPTEPGKPPEGGGGAVPRAMGKAGSAKVDGVALDAELLAPLASASRPVWIKISRKTLDHGPDGFACTDGLPSSDLALSSLRDLRIPYPATWIGWGCFNHGVYRFQFDLPVTFEVCVDGEPMCLHDAEDGKNGKDGVKFGHACLDGEHEVAVKIEGWRCDYQFVMDVYRIR